jgi:quercetin dioxygenase-like cupin family protein
MNLANQYCHFFEDDEFIETDRPGFRRRVLTGDNLQLCFWRIAGGATGSYLHKHDEHEQLGIIVRGALDFLIDSDSENSERQIIGENQVYLAPAGVWHGDSLFVGDDELNECWILDIFSPPRDDFRQDPQPPTSLGSATNG